MIKRYETCTGWSSRAFGRWKIELWYAPANYKIKSHSHPNQDIKLIFLFGKSVMFRRKKVGEVFFESFLADFPRNFCKLFNIRAGDVHDFEVSNSPLLFLNIERWKDGVKPTSASEDFQLTK